MTPAFPLSRELVLIGGGHTHALVLRRWAMKPLPGARLTLVNPGPSAAYSGMLPGFVAGHYARSEIELDLVRLARFAGARLILGAVTGIDRAKKRIEIAGHAPIAYDVASIDIGIHTQMPELPGFVEHGIAAKPLGDFAAAWAQFRKAAPIGAEIAVIGGGVAGVELAMAMTYALEGRAPMVRLVDRGRALGDLPKGAARSLRREITRQGIEIIEKTKPTKLTKSALHLASGRQIGADFALGVGGPRPYGWLAGTGLELHDGSIVVDERLQSSDPNIYAAGDCAHMAHAPRPKAGVYAVRAAPVLAANLRAALSGAQPRPYHPQGDYLKLISLGGQRALATRGRLRAQSALMWRWKDRIDRAFMDKFNGLPAMAPPPLPEERAEGMAAVLGDKPMCGGCGAKVGGAALARVLARQPKGTRADVLTRPGDDAAVLQIGAARQVLTTDHLRAFWEDPALMARIAAVHALGDIWAMGAAPQAALTQVTLPRMREGMQEGWLGEIMTEAGAVFAAEGAEIVGGHTATGAEFSIGFSVTGLVGAQPITLAGARPGDAIVLTKPIGTGVILAGEMALEARGDWVAGALASMARPQGGAARALAQAHAMTDVTGFGLAGHLMAICRASRVGAILDMGAIPVLAGAEALAARGVASTLYPANRAAVAEACLLPDSPRADLLFDPQTAGGLLAAVAMRDLKECLQRIEKAGFTPSIIGAFTEGDPHIRG